MAGSGTILITGASGRIGRRTAELLANTGQRLRLMTRNPHRAPKLPRAETVVADFAEPATLQDAFAGITTALVVSASGEPGRRAQLHRNAFEAAAAAHVEHVVYLSMMGAAPESKYPYSQDHYQSEQYLAAAGLPHTVLRNAFYMDMFLEKFDAAGVIQGPAGQGEGAFVSREDVARTAAAVLRRRPGGIHNVTGRETLSVAEVARQLSVLVGRPLRYQEESPAQARERFSRDEPVAWRVDLSVGWFEAIANGELQPPSDTVLQFSAASPLPLEQYFRAFPELLRPILEPSET